MPRFDKVSSGPGLVKEGSKFGCPLRVGWGLRRDSSSDPGVMAETRSVITELLLYVSLDTRSCREVIINLM